MVSDWVQPAPVSSEEERHALARSRCPSTENTELNMHEFSP